jgi:hypothetical protein
MVISTQHNPSVSQIVRGGYRREDEIFASLNKSFKIKVLNPLQKYLNPMISNDYIAQQFLNNPIKFYQNQLNFSMFCATTGCGVSYVNHFNHSDPLTRSVYQFHVYYQFRRILKELRVSLFGEESHDPFNNPIDIQAIQKNSMITLFLK